MTTATGGGTYALTSAGNGTICRALGVGEDDAFDRTRPPARPPAPQQASHNTMMHGTRWHVGLARLVVAAVPPVLLRGTGGDDADGIIWQ